MSSHLFQLPISPSETLYLRKPTQGNHTIEVKRVDSVGIIIEDWHETRIIHRPEGIMIEEEFLTDQIPEYASSGYQRSGPDQTKPVGNDIF